VRFSFIVVCTYFVHALIRTLAVLVARFSNLGKHTDTPTSIYGSADIRNLTGNRSFCKTARVTDPVSDFTQGYTYDLQSIKWGFIQA